MAEETLKLTGTPSQSDPTLWHAVVSQLGSCEGNVIRLSSSDPSGKRPRIRESLGQAMSPLGVIGDD